MYTKILFAKFLATFVSREGGGPFDYSSVARKIFYSKDLLLERSVARTVLKSSYSKIRLSYTMVHLLEMGKVFLGLELNYLFWIPKLYFEICEGQE